MSGVLSGRDSGMVSLSFNFQFLLLTWVDLKARRAVAHIVQSHLTMGAAPTFGPVTDKVVEYGIARLRNRHEGQNS
jgi:hypothetical protein